MPFLQDIIHRLEVGGGMRYVRLAMAALAVILLLVGYNGRAFKNFSSPEAMDVAQLARNISDGEGYTTKFVRPLSIFLIKRQNLGIDERSPSVQTNIASLKGGHPDLANPPVYPYLLAGIMKVLPFNAQISGAGAFWTPAGRFYRYQPDFLISMFNQALFLVVVWLVFLLARKLFDPTVAWVSAVVLLCAEVFWRFSVSGLSTILLLLLFTGLVWLLVLLEEEGREPKHGKGWPLLIGALIGLSLGLGALTRYSFGWILVPVIGFIALYGGPRRVPVALIVLALSGVLLGSWMVRNHLLSGTFFGTASYVLVENTPMFPEFRLQRSLDPDFSGYVRAAVDVFWHKLILNVKRIAQEELPTLGGSWAAAFFLVGLMVTFRNPATKRVRQFLVACLLLFIVVQALCRTHMSDISPELNHENLLVLFVPLVLMFGVSLFFLLLEQMPLALVELRYLVIGAFVVIACLPMVFVYLPPRPFPISYPPYNPPNIQTISNWLKPQELMMSDIPWAVAWYGNRQSVWLTLRPNPDPEDPQSHEDFFAINDYLKPISALYLTPVTIDRRFISESFRQAEYAWGSFLLQSFVMKRVPGYFPLSYVHELPYAPPGPMKPEELRKRMAALDQQSTQLGEAAQKLLNEPGLASVLESSPEIRTLLDKARMNLEGRDFPLGSAPVKDMSSLEQLILSGQLVLADRPRWKE